MAQQQDTYSGAAVGWTVFASIMLIIIGVFQSIAGITALVSDELYVVTPEYLFQFDTTTWGWVHLLIGVIVLAAGIALYSGAVWARTVGVIVAVVSAIINFAWLPWYPVWAILVITADVFVIWALTVHGRDITRA
jgi:hypothetical protein